MSRDSWRRAQVGGTLLSDFLTEKPKAELVARRRCTRLLPATCRATNEQNQPASSPLNSQAIASPSSQHATAKNRPCVLISLRSCRRNKGNESSFCLSMTRGDRSVMAVEGAVTHRPLVHDRDAFSPCHASRTQLLAHGFLPAPTALRKRKCEQQIAGAGSPAGGPRCDLASPPGTQDCSAVRGRTCCFLRR